MDGTLVCNEDEVLVVSVAPLLVHQAQLLVLLRSIAHRITGTQHHITLKLL